MKLFFTGGTGFFGCALIRFWMTQGHPESVTILSRNPARFLKKYPEFSALPWLYFHQGDIEQPETFPKEAAFTHLIHAAADSTFGAELGYIERFNQILKGTQNVLDYAVQNKIPRVLYTSSGGVYGAMPPHLDAFPENWHGIPDPLHPANVYSIAKRTTEHLCALYQKEYNLEIVIARCFAFVGRDLPLDVHFAIGNFIRDALWKEAITVGGDGTPIRSYLAQEDLAEWLMALLEKGRAGEAYNVGSDEAITIEALAYKVRDLIAPHKPVHILKQADGHSVRNRYLPELSKIKQDCGVSVQCSLEQAILNTASLNLKK